VDLLCGPTNRRSTARAPAVWVFLLLKLVFTAHGPIHGLEPGVYVALLSHSGSRGMGAAVCDHYSKIAFGQFPDLPSELKRLAWLSLDSAEGQEYWAAMELMGCYAAANHALIHRHIAENLGARVLSSTIKPVR